MRIDMFLELSTVHLSPAAIRALDQPGPWSGDYRDDPETGLCQRSNGQGQAHRWVNASTAVATVISFEHGWFVHAMADREALREKRVPEALIALLDRARDRGCDWLVLDRDAAPSDDLPAYEQD